MNNIRANTAIADAMRKAGFNTNAALLRAIATDMLRQKGASVALALGPFTEEVRDAGGVMAELVPYAVTQDLAFAYLERVAADMRGELAPRGADEKTGEGGAQGRHDRLLADSAPSLVANSEGEGAHRPGASHSGVRPSSSETNAREAQHKDGVNATVRVATPSLAPSDGGQHTSKLHATRMFAAPSSGPRLTLADHIGLQKVLNAYDTFKLRDGRGIGKLQFSAIPRFIADNSREASVLRQVRAYIGHPGANPNELIEKLVPLRELEKMIETAKELPNE